MLAKKSILIPYKLMWEVESELLDSTNYTDDLGFVKRTATGLYNEAIVDEGVLGKGYDVLQILAGLKTT